MRLSVIIPAYNSQDFIASNLRMLDDFLSRHLTDFEVIVVDDASRDRTSAEVLSIALPRVRLVTLERNLGKFGALKRGMQEACGACRVFTDADLPYELEAIPYMEKVINERCFHVVTGDRSLSASEYEQGVPLFRRVFNQLSREFIRVFVVAGIFDSQCGIKAFRGDVAEALFPLVQDNRFAADVELLYVALKYNLEIKRIPVRIQRVSPSSVRVGLDTLRMFMRIARLRSAWRTGLYRSAALEKIAAQSYWDL